MILQKLIYRPIAVGIFFFGLSVLGILSLFKLPISLLPEISYPALLIQTKYQDASAKEVEKQISEPIELQLATIQGVKHILSTSQNGLSNITILFDWQQDILTAHLAVRNKIASIRSSLPERANPSEVLSINPSSLPLMKLLLTSDVYSLDALTDYANQVLKRRFEQMDAIALAQIEGTTEQIVDIRLDVAKCQNLRISIPDIEQKLKENNIFDQGGIIRDGFLRFSLRLDAQLNSLKQIQNIVIKQNRGMQILLGQIADIRFGHQTKTASIFWKNKAAIQLNIIRKQEANAIDAAQQVRTLIQQINREEKKIAVEIAFDDSIFVEEAIYGTFQSLLWGACFAFLVLFIFLNNVRYPIYIFISIPVSILICFILFYLQNISLNIMSLGGLALGVGLLVDNSIVVLENIVRLQEEGYEKLQAVLKGTQEVILAVSASTLTTISVFAPLLLVSGISGAFFKEQALSLIYSLVTSLFVSIFLLPILFFHLKLRKPKEGVQRTPSLFSKIKQFIAWAFWCTIESFQMLLHFIGLRFIIKFLKKSIEHFYRFYHEQLVYFLAKPKKPLLVGLILSISAIVVLLNLKRVWIPKLSKNTISIECQFRSGLSLKAVESEMMRLSLSLDSLFNISGQLLMNGKVSQDFADRARLREEKAILYLFFNETVSEETIEHLKQVLRFFPSMTAELKPIKTPFEVVFNRFQSANKVILTATNRQDLSNAMKHLAQYKDLKLLMAKSTKQWRFNIDKEKQMMLELSQEEIKQSIQLFSSGVYLGRFEAEQEILPIYMHANTTKEEFKTFSLFKGNKGYPLSSFLKKTEYYEESELSKQNLIYTALYEIENLPLPLLNQRLIDFPQVEFQESYESKEVGDSLKDLLWAGLLSFIFVFMILAAQFESFKLPFIILFTVPMALVGISIVFLLSSVALSMMSVLGTIVLIGIVVNDAIIKVDFIENERKNGLRIKDAILSASQKRFRPILMTTLTTTLALLPMILIKSSAYELRLPMALAIFAGLSMATFLTLFFIPLLYQLFHKLEISKE
jgi:HAE1 family hydrophobic/amphiphilic exporter-1